MAKIYIVGSILGTFIGGLTGFILGAELGGNLGCFDWGTLQGYESCSYVFAIYGASVGLVTSLATAGLAHAFSKK